MTTETSTAPSSGLRDERLDCCQVGLTGCHPASRPARPLAQDRLEDGPSVGHHTKVALPVDAHALEARNLCDLEAGMKGSQVHLGLDLEPVAVGRDVGQNAPPECDVAVAEIGEAAAEEQPDEADKTAIAQPPQESHVRRPRTLGEAGALDEVRAGDERAHERR